MIPILFEETDLCQVFRTDYLIPWDNLQGRILKDKIDRTQSRDAETLAILQTSKEIHEEASTTLFLYSTFRLNLYSAGVHQETRLDTGSSGKNIPRVRKIRITGPAEMLEAHNEHYRMLTRINIYHGLFLTFIDILDAGLMDRRARSKVIDLVISNCVAVEACQTKIR